MKIMTQATAIRQLPIIDLSDIFVDQRWVHVGLATDRAKGFLPNRMHFNSSFQQAAIVVERSVSRQEFGLMEASLSYAEKAVEGGRIKDAHVVLKERGIYRVIAYLSVVSVRSNLHGHQPCEEKFGPCWTIDASFLIIKPHMPF
jgi:hypothetical protein